MKKPNGENMTKLDPNVIAANSDFIRLNQLLNRFNIFEATDMGRREIKHSKFLAYLLDPNESHSLGDAFLFSFLASLPVDPKIPLLSLHTELCKTCTEWRGTKGNNNSIDVYLKIPMHGQSNFLHIFIENKINSKQGINQLKKYSEMINNEGIQPTDVKIKLYLTERGEDPMNVDWHGITYYDNVIPVIEQLLKLRRETISSKIEQVLIDYIQLIGNEGDEDEEIERTIAQIDPNIINAIQESSSEYIEWQSQNLQLRFAKAWQYLSELDSDKRLDILNEWRCIKSEENLIIEGETYIFSLESSSRTHLRFSVLTEANRTKLVNLAKGSTKKWMESFRNLVFEIGLKSQDEASNQDTNNYLSWAVLVLGPLNVDQQERNSFGRFMMDKLSHIGGEREISPYYTRLIPAKKLIPTKRRDLNEIRKVISERFFDYGKAINMPDKTIELTDKFKEIVISLNTALSKYPNE